MATAARLDPDHPRPVYAVPIYREYADLGPSPRIFPHFTERSLMHGPLIAIIDDDKSLCSSIGDLLRAHDYRVELFLSAEAFVDSLDQSKFDCVIADVCMPGDGGFTLAQELRQRGSTIPIILITGLLERHLEEVALSFGAQCLLRKPLETTALLNQIKARLV
jgi:FixJ family two-component response regulator